MTEKIKIEDLLENIEEIERELNATFLGRAQEYVMENGKNYPVFQENNTGFSFMILGTQAEHGDVHHLSIFKGRTLQILAVRKLDRYLVYGISLEA